MKKLVLGLVAMVVFASFSYGNTKHPIECNSNEICFVNPPKKILSSTSQSIVAPGCQDVTIGISYIVEVSTVVRVCCRRLGSVVSGFLGVECWFVSNKSTGDLTGYINLDDLEPKILEGIKSKDLKEIKITKSDALEIGEQKYTIRNETYKIEKTDEGMFLEVILEKVK